MGTSRLNMKKNRTLKLTKKKNEKKISFILVGWVNKETLPPRTF
jgi:hypothetical protein